MSVGNPVTRYKVTLTNVSSQFLHFSQSVTFHQCCYTSY